MRWNKQFLFFFTERLYSRKISLSNQDTITFAVRDTTLKKASYYLTIYKIRRTINSQISLINDALGYDSVKVRTEKILQLWQIARWRVKLYHRTRTIESLQVNREKRKKRPKIESCDTPLFQFLFSFLIRLNVKATKKMYLTLYISSFFFVPGWTIIVKRHQKHSLGRRLCSNILYNRQDEFQLCFTNHLSHSWTKENERRCDSLGWK